MGAEQISGPEKFESNEEAVKFCFYGNVVIIIIFTFSQIFIWLLLIKNHI